MESGAHPGEAVTAAIFKAMQDKLAEQKQNLLSIDDVTAMVAGQVGQFVLMDEETIGQFRQLMKKVITSKGEYYGNSKSW